MKVYIKTKRTEKEIPAAISLSRKVTNLNNELKSVDLNFTIDGKEYSLELNKVDVTFLAKHFNAMLKGE